MDKDNQAGWAVMEYLIGAILIIAIVGTVIGVVSQGLSTKAQNVSDALSK